MTCHAEDGVRLARQVAQQHDEARVDARRREHAVHRAHVDRPARVELAERARRKRMTVSPSYDRPARVALAERTRRRTVILLRLFVVEGGNPSVPCHRSYMCLVERRSERRADRADRAAAARRAARGRARRCGVLCRAIAPQLARAERIAC